MKQKGFTLIELLAVLGLLIIIFMLIYPSVTKIISQSRETTYNKQINTIINAAYDFSLKNIDFLPEKGNQKYILLSQLKHEGLLPVDIKNPNTGTNFPDNLVVSINNVGSNYQYSGEYSKLKGHYLYTVELENLDNDNLVNMLPEIVLSDDLNRLKRNSDGNYIITLDLNQELFEIHYTATSKNNVDLTDEIIRYMSFNDKAVDSFDSSKQGVYKINYSVVDDNGYARAIVLNVIVADNLPPTISFPENTIISKDEVTYDLMGEVSCTDNSGFCDITYIGTIKFGVTDTYLIEYTAKDPSGNTTIQKRAITVE